MSHTLAGLGTASLDVMGGLITNVSAEDLPEGASSRTWDTDYIVGSVFTRPGLSSVYTFTTTFTIISVSIRSGIATFVYSNLDTVPTVNDAFLLSGFSGAASFLNGETVVVSSVDPGSNTFFSVVDFPDLDPVTGLTATAASTTGNFIGPNIGTAFNVINSDGNTWSNPEGILGNTVYATSTTGSTVNIVRVPGAAANQDGANAWASPSNILTTGSSFATVTLGTDSTSAAIIANAINFSLPADATITGIKTSFSAKSTSAAGKGSFNIQLATNGFGVGTAVNVPVGPTLATYEQGSSAFQWGTTLTTTIVNGASFGILIDAVEAVGGSGSFSINSLSLTVYYTTASSSEVLQAKTFTFAVPSTSGISGMGITFEAYSDAATTVTLQLLKNGLPVGETREQVLNTTPTIYTLGAKNDLWGNTWTFSDINNTAFGVQIVVSGTGTTHIRDLDMLVYVTPSLANFNYIKSFIQNSGQITTLALDSSGILWRENVNDSPGTLAVALTGILPGSFAKSTTAFDQEYICFSDLAVGTERPRIYNGTTFFPLSQVGPGAPPSFISSVGTTGQQLSISNFSISGNIVTFTYTGIEPDAGDIYQITGAASPFQYLNFTGTVLGTGLTPTQFEMELVHVNVSSTPITATGTLLFTYPIASITQPAAHTNFIHYEWSAGPGQNAPGTVLTIYYSDGPQDPVLLAAFNAGIYPVYVFLSGISFGFNGTYQVTGLGFGIPAGHDTTHNYFTVNVGSSGRRSDGAAPGSYQQTISTVTTTVPVPGLVQGDSILITQASPSGWNNTWSIVNALKSGVLNITNTAMSAAGVATYQFNVASGVGPHVNDIITITNCTNNAIFNTTGVIATVSGSQFTITGFSSGVIAPAFESNASGITFGKQFLIDPGSNTLGLATSPIFGNDSNTGIITLGGGATTPIGSGTRQGVVFFITETGYYTTPSPPVVFTTSSQANFINAGSIPIGPPNVIARGIAFTEAGQNGVPGANFYVIPNDVTITVGNTTTVYTSTIIRDNVTTDAKFTFTDAVLLNSTEVDIEGNDLFNLIELGSSAWCVKYASRMFYGLQLNKVDNFNNLTFDGGYLPNQGGNLRPLGWAIVDQNSTDLNTSTVTGMSLIISNNTGATLSSAGKIYQTAFQDAYLVPIIRAHTTYSIRVAARCPSGVQVGTLKLSLVDFNQGIGFGTEYGEFEVPLTDMTSNIAVFTGTILTTPFENQVSPQLQFVVECIDLGDGADCEIDRIEIFPTIQPYLKAQVYGSYLNNFESIDASGAGGIIDTSTENSQDCMGAFIMHDNMYLLKSNSMYFTQDDPTSQPSGWGVHEVSNKVGTIGISSYDAGEEWLVTACRAGIYGFNGGQPVKLMQEIWNVWELINWDNGNTIVLRNDIINRRLLCAVPLPTPNKWLPFDPENSHPTTPNVILMCNYQGMNSFEELVGGAQVHTTMFGTLASVDMRRKWSIWRIPTPYMDFIARQDGENDKELFVCNGISSSKIYQFLDDQLSDDGVAINGLYTTYGFVNATKAATLPIFGFHAKRYTVLQMTANGAGSMRVRALQNTLRAVYPYTVAGGVTLKDPAFDDWFRPLNVRGNRCFLEFSTNAVGAWFQLHKVLLSGKADSWATLNPTGGGNAGFPAV